ncbi:leucine-, glutamate- and lysine-rich protein 1-like [Plakobranchus ocellatus]|uniref:Leucine-, glutamate- and lysine-rich protein 1-like n=1 Tax=Plakobranchus ocellatus TaxID=259542 RepID=A0AAV4BT64_9GAST|nr:leucine-, glutamate- and lysine-rich protein 1-like [Plakobranchus ocellatus]
MFNLSHCDLRIDRCRIFRYGSKNNFNLANGILISHSTQRHLKQTGDFLIKYSTTVNIKLDEKNDTLIKTFRLFGTIASGHQQEGTSRGILDHTNFFQLQEGRAKEQGEGGGGGGGMYPRQTDKASFSGGIAKPESSLGEDKNASGDSKKPLVEEATPRHDQCYEGDSAVKPSASTNAHPAPAPAEVGPQTYDL